MYHKNELFTAGKPILVNNNGLLLDRVTELMKKALEDTNAEMGLNIEILEDKAEIRTVFSSRWLPCLVIRSLDGKGYPDYVLAYNWTGGFVDVNRAITQAKPKALPEEGRAYIRRVDELVTEAMSFK